MDKRPYEILRGSGCPRVREEYIPYYEKIEEKITIGMKVKRLNVCDKIGSILDVYTERHSIFFLSAYNTCYIMRRIKDFEEMYLWKIKYL